MREYECRLDLLVRALRSTWLRAMTLGNERTAMHVVLETGADNHHSKRAR